MHEPWAGRYQAVVPIRCRGTLHLYSGRELESDRLHVVAMAPRIPEGEARAMLGNLARVHRLVAGEGVPGVANVALEGPTPWVALECDGIADLEHATDVVRQSGDKPNYEQGSALGKMLMETLSRVHRVSDPESGRNVCLGSLAAGNILISRSGKLSLIGFGAGAMSGACIAPEVASGALPTAGADVYALTLFMRAQLEFVRMPSVIRRIFLGSGVARDSKLLILFAWSNLKILAAAARRRPDMDASLVQARKMWGLLGIVPDTAGLAFWLSGALATEPERLADAPSTLEAPRILVGSNAEWLEAPNGMRHALGARRPLRRFLLALVEARHARPGAAVTVDELLQAAWPGENPLPEAGNNRVYVAVSTLRKMGLKELQRWDGGYRLDPSVPCELKES